MSLNKCWVRYNMQVKLLEYVFSLWYNMKSENRDDWNKWWIKDGKNKNTMQAQTIRKKQR